VANEQDIRDIRAGVHKIATEGCAHKEGHDKSIDDLWSALGKEKLAREGLFVKIVMMVLGIVLAAMVANVYSTSAVVERVLSKALVAQTTGIILKR
jgi:hypothetical protein